MRVVLPAPRKPVTSRIGPLTPARSCQRPPDRPAGARPGVEPALGDHRLTAHSQVHDPLPRPAHSLAARVICLPDIGSAPCSGRECLYVYISFFSLSVQNKHL